jgi:molybdopterin converting factor small subunit
MEASTVTVRYWASARAAAGVAADALPVDGTVTLAELRDRAVALHPDTRLEAVLAVCSVLVGDRPVATQDPATVMVGPGETVEFLPPFAGG